MTGYYESVLGEPTPVSGKSQWNQGVESQFGIWGLA